MDHEIEGRGHLDLWSDEMVPQCSSLSRLSSLNEFASTKESQSCVGKFSRTGNVFETERISS